MNSKPQDLRSRTKALALRVIRMYGKLPRRYETTVIGGQVLRSGTSVGAHYREASRGRSTAEFVSKLEGGLQELDETGYWLELLAESGSLPPADLQPATGGRRTDLNLRDLCKEREARSARQISIPLLNAAFKL